MDINVTETNISVTNIFVKLLLFSVPQIKNIGGNTMILAGLK